MENLLFDWKELRVEGTTITQPHHNTIGADKSRGRLSTLSTNINEGSIRYQRALDDLPCCGKQLRLLVLVRRFFCLNQECARRLFVELVSEVATPFARKTNRPNQTLQTIGLALGGEAGARTVEEMRVQVSPDTLIR
jgi:hypothetical protein